MVSLSFAGPNQKRKVGGLQALLMSQPQLSSSKIHNEQTGPNESKPESSQSVCQYKNDYRPQTTCFLETVFSSDLDSLVCAEYHWKLRVNHRFARQIPSLAPNATISSQIHNFTSRQSTQLESPREIFHSNISCTFRLSSSSPPYTHPSTSYHYNTTRLILVISTSLSPWPAIYSLQSTGTRSVLSLPIVPRFDSENLSTPSRQTPF